MVTCAVRSPEGSRYCRLSACAYGLQRAIPSARGSVTSRSRDILHSRRRNLNRLVIRFPLRVPLSPRLTLIRLTLFRKPWVFGVDVSSSIIVTYAYIFFSGRSSIPYGTPSTPTGMLPYHSPYGKSIASAMTLIPVYHPRNAARLVSCYALFK